MLFKVFHRTLEFNLLLPISLITASFFGFFNKSYYFVSSISSGSLSKVSRTVQGTSFKSLMRLLTFRLFKGRYVTVK